MYHYLFIDRCVRVEDFPAWQRNTTPTDAPHKMAFLHHVESIGIRNFFQGNISQLFLENLGGFPLGPIDLRVWALRWGDGMPDSGIKATIDSINIWVPERVAMAILSLSLLSGMLRSLLARTGKDRQIDPPSTDRLPKE